MEHDFGGYATKAGLKCSDGRTIMPDAFKQQDKATVPLVWQHGHNEPANILGHAVLENRPDGVYAYGFFNSTEQGQSSKALVQHKDIRALSIYANSLVERSKNVIHGAIKEVSLVIAGANPGAMIDFVRVAHNDGSVDVLDDEAVIYTDLPLDVEETVEHSETDVKPEEAETEEKVEHKDTQTTTTVEHKEDTKVADDEKTVKDVYNSLNDEQKNVVSFMIGAALEEAGSSTASHSDTNNTEGTTMTNVFEQDNKDDNTQEHVLSHSDIKGIVSNAVKSGSLKEAVEDYAFKHGIENIDVLFPDAKNVMSQPEWNTRRTEWVAGVLNGARHTPFSRLKTVSADLTHEEARAKGYIKGNMKKEQFFSVVKRVTTPTTIYKKQKLDRDDIVDITDFDVVAWLKGEMRLMLEEELARAVLIGDGREVDDEDKINEEMIRPIAKDNELYVTTVRVNIDDANSSMNEVVDSILRSRRYYKGSGTPTFYTTEVLLTELLLTRDQFGRRMYRTVDELASELRVAAIVPVEVMEDETDTLGVIVNLVDYTIGADRGGDVSLFDDFDIDYNQYKYLIETRVSGALTRIKSAIVVKKVGGTNVLATPQEPSFNATTGALSVPTVTGVVYKHGSTTLTTAGSPYTVPAGQTWVVDATPANGYYFSSSEDDQWSYTHES